MTFFPALDREWILWTPHGFYETSALGDRRYLGWHRNPLREGEPTDYFAFDRFEQELRRPDALLRFWRTADRSVLAAAPAGPVQLPPPGPAQPQAPRPISITANEPVPVVAANPLPIVEVVAPARPAFDPLVVPGGPLAIRIRAATEEVAAGRGLIRAVRILVDGGKVEESRAQPAPGGRRPTGGAQPQPGESQGQRVRQERSRSGADDELRRDRAGAAAPPRADP